MPEPSSPVESGVVTGPVEARVLAAAKAMALEGEDDGCFERLAECEAMEPREKDAHGDPGGIEEDCQYWISKAAAGLAAADAVDPLRAADECSVCRAHSVVGRIRELQAGIAQARRERDEAMADYDRLSRESAGIAARGAVEAERAQDQGEPCDTALPTICAVDPLRAGPGGGVVAHPTESVVRAAVDAIYRAYADPETYGHTRALYERDAAIVIAAAEPLIAARVRAESETERAAIMAVIEQYLPEALPFNTLPEIVGGIARQRDFQHELKDHLAEVARRLTDERDRAIAEAVADERQRITGMVAGMRCVPRPEMGWDYGYNVALERVCERLAAGSVPATTPRHDVLCERLYGEARCFCRRRADVDFSHSAGPAALPADTSEPVDEVKCPKCEATIRARMSDAPEVAARAVVATCSGCGRPGHTVGGCGQSAQGELGRVPPSEIASYERPHGPHCYPWDWQHGDNEPNCAHQPAEQDGQR